MNNRKRARSEGTRNIQEYVAKCCVVALNNQAQHKLDRLEKRLEELEGCCILRCIFCKDVFSEDDLNRCHHCERRSICQGCMKKCTECHDTRVCRECISFCEAAKCKAECCPDCIQNCERCHSGSYCWNDAAAAECCVESSDSSQ